MSKKAGDGVIEETASLDIENGRWIVADSYGRRYFGQLPEGALALASKTLAQVVEEGDVPNVLPLFPAYELNVIQQQMEDGRMMMGLQALPVGIFAVGAPLLVRWNGLLAVHELPEIDRTFLRDGLVKAEDMKTQFRAARSTGRTLSGPPRISLR
jgi:hypothetical protein